MRWMRPLLREDGSSMVAVVLVMLVLVVIGATSVQVALHSNDATTVDRQRVQAVQAAEAGIHTAINRLQVNPACDSAVSAPEDITDGADVLARYQVRVDPEASMPCTTANRVIRAWGYSPVSSERSVRQLEVSVQLVPQDGFQFTLFAAGTQGIVVVKNTGTVNGDIYAENLDQTQNNINADKVLSPGSIDTKNNAVYSGTLWAGGNVTLRQNGQVGGSIIAAGSSAAGDVTLENNVVIAKDVKAKGSINLPTTYTIGGSSSQNNPNIPPPPVLDKPTFTWNPVNYTPAPQIFSTAAAMTAALEANKNALGGTYYLNAPSSTVSMPRNATVTGPLNVITTGKVEMGRSLTASGGTWPVAIVTLNNGTAAINVDQPFTAGAGIELLLFSNGEVDLKNQVSMAGAIYADKIAIKNSVVVGRSAVLAHSPPPGFDFSQASAAQFLVVPTLWREVSPGTLPS